jgi:hypothetical protein
MPIMIMNTQEMTNEELANAAVMYYSIAANDNGSYTYLMTLLQGKFGERVDVEELVEAMETRMREFIKEKLDETDAKFYKSPTDGYMWRDVTEDCLEQSKRDELFAAHELFGVCDDDTDHLIEDANDINAIIEGGAKICIEYNNIK